MKMFSCGDVVTGCPGEFHAETDAELLAHATVHAQHAHGLTDPHMPAVLTARVRAAIRVTG